MRNTRYTWSAPKFIVGDTVSIVGLSEPWRVKMVHTYYTAGRHAYHKYRVALATEPDWNGWKGAMTVEEEDIESVVTVEGKAK